MTRRYDVVWLDDDGCVHEFTRVAPAIGVFEQAFSALAHGAVIQTTEGPVSVEDLVPGMGVETAGGEIAVLRWVGSMTMIPNAPQTGDRPNRMYRVTGDATGFGRSSGDVTFGPGARLMNRDPAVRAVLGQGGALAPVASLEDGTGVVAINPISPVRVYHLSFDDHHTIRAGGIEIETFHPGTDAHYLLSDELRGMFLHLFPHKKTLADFGRLAAPRYELSEDGFELV